MLTGPTPARPNPVARLLRQFVTVALLLASVAAALSLDVWGQTRAVVWPPSLTERYNSLLADLYLASTDWQVIHHIEREVDAAALSEPERAAFTAQVWRNYQRAPEEYQALGYLEVIEAALAEHTADFQAILRDRAQYPADEPPVVAPPDQLSDPHSTEDLLALLAALSTDVEASRAALAEGGVAGGPVNLAALESYQRVLAHARELAAREIPYAGLAPRYQAIVYDSYQRVQSDALIEESQAILLDRAEDPTLRLLAADYLRQYGDRALLMEQLYQLVADARVSGVYVEGDPADAPQDGLFARGLLEVLRRTVVEQSRPPQPEPAQP